MVFALGLWLAHYIRFNWRVVVDWLREFGMVKWVLHFLRYDVLRVPLPPNPYAPDVIAPFSAYLSLFVIVIPLAVIILHSQGFYQQAISSRRRVKVWQLARACFLTTIGLILVSYL